MLGIEKALFMIDIFFIVLQFGFAVTQLRRLISKNTTQFYLMQDASIASSFKEHNMLPLNALGKAFDVKLKNK